MTRDGKGKEGGNVEKVRNEGRLKKSERERKSVQRFMVRD